MHIEDSRQHFNKSSQAVIERTSTHKHNMDIVKHPSSSFQIMALYKLSDVQLQWTLLPQTHLCSQQFKREKNYPQYTKIRFK